MFQDVKSHSSDVKRCLPLSGIIKLQDLKLGELYFWIVFLMFTCFQLLFILREICIPYFHQQSLVVEDGCLL